MWKSSEKCASPFEPDRASADVVHAAEVMTGVGITSFQEDEEFVDVDGLSESGSDSEEGEDEEEDDD